jgi:hypothetical protein
MEREASNIDSKIQKGAFSTEPIKRNALVFAIVMILLQIALCLIYGFLITVPVVQLNISSVIVTIGLVILVVCGNFMSYLRFWIDIRIHKTACLEWHRLHIFHNRSLHIALPIGQRFLDKDGFAVKQFSC